MSRAYTNGNDVDIDIARLFVAVWERRLAILSLMLIVCAAAFVISGTIDPRYRAESRVLIEAREPVFSQGDGSERGQTQFLDEQGIGSQVEIINSTNLIKSVAEQLDLVDNPEFSAAARRSIFSSIPVMLGLSSDPFEVPPEERLIETFREHLTVYQVANTRVIAISFWSTDRQLSAQVANAMADAYLSIQSGAKLSSNADTTAWLEPQIADLREKVRLAEAKVADYRAESGLLLVDENATIATQQLTEITTELSRVRGNKAEAQARATAVANAIENGYSTEQFANTTQSEVIRQLRDRQATLQSDIADLSVTLLDGHPRIKGLRSQLRDIDEQIQAEAQNLLRGFESEAEVAQLREDELVAQLEALKADSARAGGEEVELRALEREARAQRELLEAYLSRYREAASRSDRGNLPADARIISEALVPIKPYFPKTGPIVVIAALATLFLAAIVIMMRELFSGRAMKPVDYGQMQTKQADLVQPNVSEQKQEPPQAHYVPDIADISQATDKQIPDRDEPADKASADADTGIEAADADVSETTETVDLVPAANAAVDVHEDADSVDTEDMKQDRHVAD